MNWPAFFFVIVFAFEGSRVLGKLEDETFDKSVGVNVVERRREDLKQSNEECNLSPELISEIAGYKGVVSDIINATLNGVYKGRTWRTLARFIDNFGSRITGSQNLEDSIDYMVGLLEKNQLENVHTEPVLVPHWVRGKEMAYLLSPRLEKFTILGLGYSVGTPAGGIIANIVVVTSFDDLLQKGKQVMLLMIEVMNHVLSCDLISLG